eukprot:COSAG01_NODE_4001_length_5444_cov_8.703087_6_plen_73_part_00
MPVRACAPSRFHTLHPHRLGTGQAGNSAATSSANDAIDANQSEMTEDELADLTYAFQAAGAPAVASFCAAKG